MNGNRTFRNLAILTVAAAAALPGAIAATAQAPATSDTYSYATYRERDDRLTVLVDAWPASLREEAAFIPLPIAVGLKGRGGPVRFHAEAFTLIDASGHEYPLASYQAILSGYPQRTFDATILRSRPIVTGLQFDSMTQASSRFFPAPGRGTRTEYVELSPFTWFQDVLYFPRPADMDGVLTLRVQARGLEHPAEVRFRIPESRPLGTH